MKMSISAVVTLLACCVGESADWVPPEKPVPWNILREANEDAREARYEIALAKHIWYHEHAEEHDGSGKSYRLSIALRQWHELGKRYPPALKKLIGFRDRAIERVKKGEDATAAFEEYAEINRQLQQHDLTSKSFRWFNEHAPKVAEAVFRPASQALLARGEYELYGKYVVPKRERTNIINFHRTQLRLAESDSKYKAQRLKAAEDILKHKASMLVACLVLAEREDDAKATAEILRKLSNSARFHELLDNALKGVIPPPLGKAHE